MSQPLFGLVPAGQPMVVTPTQAPTPTSFLYAIPPAAPGAKPFSHIVVFLLPGVALPAGTAAAIYLVTPPTAPGQTEPNSRFLGGIGPGKESAIFKLASSAPAGAAGAGVGAGAEGAGAGAGGGARGGAAAAGGGGGGGGGAGANPVVIGVSIEAADSVAARMSQVSSSATGGFAASGAGAGGAGTGNALVPVSWAGSGQQPNTLALAQRIIKNAFNFLSSFSGTAGQVEVVPLKAFEEWWKKFEGRVRSDPGFLERDE